MRGGGDGTTFIWTPSKFWRSHFQKLPLIFLSLHFQRLVRLLAEQEHHVCSCSSYFWWGKKGTLIRLIWNPEGMNFYQGCVEGLLGGKVAMLVSTWWHRKKWETLWDLQGLKSKLPFNDNHDLVITFLSLSRQDCQDGLQCRVQHLSCAKMYDWKMLHSYSVNWLCHWLLRLL